MQHTTTHQYREVGTAHGRPAALTMPSRQQSASVLGLDEVGVVAVACLAHLGVRVIGVDSRADRVKGLGYASPVAGDFRLETLLRDGTRQGRIAATRNLAAAVLDTDITIVSGAARNRSGLGGATSLAKACRNIGSALAKKAGFHVVLVRGEPSGTDGIAAAREAIEQASGKVVGREIGLAYMPTFGRLAITTSQFFSPHRTLIGASNSRTAAIVLAVFEPLDGEAQCVSLEAAQMATYVESLRLVMRKIFDTDIRRLCDAVGVPADELGIVAPRRPGSAAAGSDTFAEHNVAAMVELTRRLGLALPTIESLSATSCAGEFSAP